MNENRKQRLMTHDFLASSAYGEYKWTTTYYHEDNTFTMQDFINHHLPPNYEVTFDDGSYVEVICLYTGNKYRLDAKGDGDCYHHVIDWRQF